MQVLADFVQLVVCDKSFQSVLLNEITASSTAVGMIGTCATFYSNRI